MKKVTLSVLSTAFLLNFSAYAEKEKLIITIVNNDMDLQVVKLSEVPPGSYEIKTTNTLLAPASEDSVKTVTEIRSKMGTSYESQEKRPVVVCDSETGEKIDHGSYSQLVIMALDNCQFTTELNFLMLHKLPKQ